MDDHLKVYYYGCSSVRILRDHTGDPWWVAKDVCEILGLSNVAMAVQGLDADEKLISTLLISGQNRETWTVNEPGLYRLIMRSNKQEAKEFQRWIAHEVLPQIRAMGRYDAMIPKTLSQALMLAGQLQAQVEEQEKQLALAAPKVKEHDLFMDGSNFKTIANVAKVLGTGQKRLFQLLRDKRILQSNNVPYQQFIDAGYFVVKERPIARGDEVFNYTQTFVTPRGESYLSKRIMEN